ncbi:MAG: hypothetical protein AAGF81_13495 [Pseudomonadota bacterium]
MLRLIFFIAAMAIAATSAHAAVPSTALKGSGPSVAADFELAQNNGHKLIAPSAAARIARRVAPASKLLNVELRGGGPPRYFIKARNKGKVHIIVIDAKTGSVMRR